VGEKRFDALTRVLNHLADTPPDHDIQQESECL
ncbi:hypothetical protein PPOP_3463, partial [Paenibacillus popilliae ATCC 14706]